MDMGGLGDMLGKMFLPNTYGPGAGPPSPQGAPNPMTPPLWRPQNNLDDPLLQRQPYTPPPTMPPPEELMQRGPAPVPSAPPGGMLDRVFGGVKSLLPQGREPDPGVAAPMPMPPGPLGVFEQRAREREAIPSVAPKLPMTPPGGGIQGMINHPFVQSILADPRKMQAAMNTPTVQAMLQDPQAQAYLQHMLQGR